MILNELQIIERLTRTDETRIKIKPLIDLKHQLGPSSIDVRLGTEFRVIRRQEYTHLDPSSKKSPAQIERDVKRYTEEVLVRFHPKYGGFVLHPGEFALGSTLEYISLPNDIAARLEGRSSWSRIGLMVHVTGGFIDPGFHGTITFELCNLGKVPILLYVGLRLAQLAFYEVLESLRPYPEKIYQKYAGQAGTGVSRFYEDYEFDILRQLHKEGQEQRSTPPQLKKLLSPHLVDSSLK